MIRPPIIWRNVKNARARSYPWFIEIEPQWPLGTLAEEVAEWQHKAALFIPAALLAGGAAGFAGWQIAGLVGAILAGLVGLFAGTVLGNNLRSGTRAIEYWGKAVHVAAGGDLDKLARELSGYGQFRGAVPAETIRAEIAKRIPKALVWLQNNEPALERIYGRRA